MTKAVIFGPWVGEFSYEISWWIPELRKIRFEKLPSHHAVAIGYSGRGALYKDFVDEYISYPKELQQSLGYPSMSFILENGQHVIPRLAQLFMNKAVTQKKKVHEQVLLVNPNAQMINKRMQERPVGIYRHLVPDDKFLKIVKTNLQKLPKGREFVAVNVYARKRVGFQGDSPEKNWNPESWQEFVIRCIKELKLNVVLFGVPQRGLYPGSLRLSEMPKLAKYNKYILDLIAENDDSLEVQSAILKLTKCSIWGATGAVVLAFLTNTPVFAHQAKEYGWRLNFEWERLLTENHKRVRIFDKYSVNQMWNSPVDDIFDNFKKFFRSL